MPLKDIQCKGKKSFHLMSVLDVCLCLYFSERNMSSLLENISCMGTEAELSQCTKNDRKESCCCNSIAAVACSSKNKNFKNIFI